MPVSPCGAAVTAFGLALVVAGTGQAFTVRSGGVAVLNREEPEMVRVAGGTFVMGISDVEMEHLLLACVEEIGEDAAHVCSPNGPFFRDAVARSEPVYIYPFDLDRREVTVADYRACVEAGGCDLTPLASGDTRYIVDEWPVVNVNWAEAKAYCEWREKRLPTEAEWERAARGDDGRRWPWGNVDAPDRANRGMVEPSEVRGAGIGTTTDESDGSKIMAPPGTFKWGKSPYGVDDMAGNVSEWVGDWHSEHGYLGLSLIDPRGATSGTYRVVRGGSYEDPKMFARTYMRSRAMPDQRSITRGFRCARDVDVI